MTEKTYKVSGMSCGHCAMHVKNALEELEGVLNGDVSLQEESVKIRFDESMVSFDDMKQAVEEAGYGLVEK